MKRLDELITWARIKFKSRKSLQKGVRNNFTIDGENIPLIADQPIRSLEKQHTSSLSDEDTL